MSLKKIFDKVRLDKSKKNFDDINHKVRTTMYSDYQKGINFNNDSE